MIDSSSLKSVSELRLQGFDGFAPVAELREGKVKVPAKPGVYLILRDCASDPEFRKPGTGGYFKRKDPNVSIAVLEKHWVNGALIVYAGQTERTLEERIGELIDFGQGKRVAHWGGRYVWQLAQPEGLVLCWKGIEGDDPKRVKKELIEDFKSTYGKRPFANLRD